MTIGPRRVQIRWDDPRSLKAVKKRDSKEDYGLYQIYSHHIVFGAGALVYIGITQKQTFADRFIQHEREWLSEEYDVSIRLGRLWKEDDQVESERRERLSDTEALLIHWHSPPYNSQHISDYSGPPLSIQNWGNRGSLLPECSSDWEVPRPRDLH